MKGEKLPAFLDWCLKVLATTDGMINMVYVTVETFLFVVQSLEGSTFVTGVLSALSSLFKHGKREDLVQYGMVMIISYNSFL